ncbi:MAG TPA: 6-phosphogluconolactonase [Candidatus Limnocylindria bacterium]|nr:6-phosphogluconolactonase [Candidatus Limnocylindria bacterium]
MSELHVFDAGAALARAGAEMIATAAAGARGRFNLALSGGRTPEQLYRTLAGDEFRERMNWARVRIYFADERAVPPTDPASNFRLARETLIDPAGIPAPNVHRMKGDYADLDAAVVEYEAHLVEPMDVLVLGVGEDGHTASIFPSSPLTVERVCRVAVVRDSPKPPPIRLTITPRVIREARKVIVQAIGREKAEAVARALEGTTDIREIPARMLREYVWLIDRAAAARLAGAS